MEIRKKIVKLKNVTQIPLYDSFITRDGDKLITRDGDYITWVRIESAYATDAVYDGATYSFVEHYVLSDGTESATRKTYNRFAPSVSITSAPISEIITANPTSWRSSITSALDIGERLYESYDGWNMYFEEYDIAAAYINEDNTYTITARAEVASRMVYHDQFLTVNFTATTSTFNTSVTQEYNTTTKTYDTNFIVGVVSGSLTASDNHYVAVYNTTAISDFPTEWGKFKNMTTTCAPSTDNGTYVYTHSLKFENGTLLIVEDNSAASVPSYDPNLFTSDTNSALNGGAYRQGTWHHTIASDEGDYMLWKTSNGSSIRSLGYISATAMNWYTYNGEITVHAHNFTYSVNNGVLNIFKDGNAHGPFKVLS